MEKEKLTLLEFKRLDKIPGFGPSKLTKKFGGLSKEHIVMFWKFFQKCGFIIYEEDQIPATKKSKIAQMKQNYEGNLEELAKIYLTDVEVVANIEAQIVEDPITDEVINSLKQFIDINSDQP